MGFKDHGVLLYMNSIMLSGYIKLQAKKDLNRSNAGLLLLAHGLFKEECISKDDYERLKTHYSKPLSQTVEPEIPLTQVERELQQKLKEKARQFKLVLEQWNLDHKMGWREVWLQEAEKYPQLPEAQAIIHKYVGKLGVN